MVEQDTSVDDPKADIQRPKFNANSFNPGGAFALAGRKT